MIENVGANGMPGTSNVSRMMLGKQDSNYFGMPGGGSAHGAALNAAQLPTIVADENVYRL